MDRKYPPSTPTNLSTGLDYGRDIEQSLIRSLADRALNGSQSTLKRLAQTVSVLLSDPQHEARRSDAALVLQECNAEVSTAYALRVLGFMLQSLWNLDTKNDMMAWVKEMKHGNQILILEGLDQLQHMKVSSDFSDRLKMCKFTLVSAVVESMGLPPREFIEAWNNNSNDVGYYKENIQIMRQLNKECPGSVLLLFQKYRIRNFARHDLVVLKEQFLQHQRGSVLPFTLIVGAQDDETRSIEAAKDAYTRLAREMNDRGGQMIVSEVASPADFVTIMSTLKNRFRGVAGPMQNLIYDGHGITSRTFLAATGHKPLVSNVLHTYDTYTEHAKQVAKRFLVPLLAPRAHVIFGSCYAGKIQGLASGVAQLLRGAGSDARVIASSSENSPFEGFTFLNRGYVTSLQVFPNQVEGDKPFEYISERIGDAPLDRVVVGRDTEQDIQKRRRVPHI